MLPKATVHIISSFEQSEKHIDFVITKISSRLKSAYRLHYVAKGNDLINLSKNKGFVSFVLVFSLVDYICSHKLTTIP